MRPPVPGHAYRCLHLLICLQPHSGVTQEAGDNRFALRGHKGLMVYCLIALHVSSLSVLQIPRMRRVMRSSSDSEQPTTGHPAKANCCMVLSLVNWHSENASNEALLICRRKKALRRGRTDNKGCFSNNQNRPSSPVLVMMRIASDNRLHESAIGCYSAGSSSMS